MSNKIQVQIEEMFGKWKIIETNITNPNSQTKDRLVKVWSKIICTSCNETIRVVRTNALKKQISYQCNKCALIERNTKGRQVQVGNKYGKLTVIGDAGFKQSSGNKRRHYSVCQCDCGSEPVIIMDNQLQTGNTVSCGCVKSKGESLIAELLTKNKILFNTEYSHPPLVKETGRKLRFDFVLYNETGEIDRFVEYDGEQHFTGMQGGTWSNGDSLSVIQERDEIKNQYCLSHNISLIRIPYFELNKITIEHILGDTFKVTQ